MVLAALLLCRPSAAEEADPVSVAQTPLDDAAATRSARRHFKNGVKLYKDTNYKGALAEFEAAYGDKPTAGSLQNVALSLKALFRYAEAADTLGQLLDHHGQELSPAEQEAVREAMRELSSLVGTLKVTLSPPQASLSVNGRETPPERRDQGIALNVGEHTLVADAPGYARHAEVVRIASQQLTEVEIALRPTEGFLEVVTEDPRAAIALDDEPLAYHRWSGPVAPGTQHTLQIYRDGFEPTEQTIELGVGQTLRVAGKLGPQIDEVDESTPLPSKPAAPKKANRAPGWYALAGLSVVGFNDAPLGLRVSGTSGNQSLPSLGVRGGYRLFEPVAVEASLETGELKATKACQEADPAGGDCTLTRDFALRSVRFGPSLRLMTQGERLRFTTAVGVGIVRHKLELEPASENQGSTSGMLSGGTASGTDPYFSLELGAWYNFGHVLAGLGAIAFVEGANGLRGKFDEEEERAVFDKGTLPMLGVALTLGYSAWKPR